MILIDSSMILAFNNFVSCRFFSPGEESFVTVLAQVIIICELSFWVTRGDELSGTATNDSVSGQY